MFTALSVKRIVQFALCFFFITQTILSQVVIRPYTLIYSDNIKGGTAVFGNTSMHIIDNNVANTTKMNETGNAANGQGGVGFSQYGNDNENMQFADVDGSIASTTIFSTGASSWRYLANGSNQGIAWRTLVNPGSPWTTANASFGYNRSQTTTISSGNVTSYYLKTINITNPSAFSRIDVTLSYDDGAVVYVNGTEVRRSNMPAGTITYTTTASGNDFITGETFSIEASNFVAGNNIIAVEIHQNNANSTDCFFDMSMTGIAINTINSSSADLILPAGTNTIKFARLYWGGRISSAVVTGAPDTLRKVKIRKGTSGAYTSVTTAAANVDQYPISGSDITYQAYVDVTAYLQSNGAGTYTIADIPATTGSISGGGEFAGWYMMVAYQNLSMNYNSVRMYDGYFQVYNNGTGATQIVTLTGLNVPNNPLSLSEAVISTIAWEGDANLSASAASPAGDYLKINNITYSNAVNPATNMWNGSISKNGVYVTTKNPNYTNQMGIDIDEFEIGSGYGIQPDADTVKIEFGTEADQYFPNGFTFNIKMKDPAVTLDKTVDDADHNHLVNNGELLTYTISGANTGQGTAFNCFIVDSLPDNVTYVANTLEVVSCPGISAGIKTDAADGDIAFKAVNGSKNYVKFFIGTGATNIAGGQLTVGQTYSLKFKVQAVASPGSVVNTARIRATSEAGDPFVDDGTAALGPQGSLLPVKLTSFTAKLVNDAGLLKWSTESEVKNDRFEVERSDDGIHFSYRGSINGNGTSQVVHDYQYSDPLATTAAIVYYRLRIIDIDGKGTYSKIIALKLNGTLANEMVTVYPNPFMTGVKISMNSSKEEDAVFRILAIDGKELVRRIITIQKGDNIIVLRDLQQLNKGNYMLEIISSSGKLVKKLVKN
jgi:uncharacterized repeat protein (TIGR01451 family)